MNNPGKEKVSPNESSSKGKSMHHSTMLLEGGKTTTGLTPSRMLKYNGATANGGAVLGSTTIDIHSGHMSDQAFHCSASSVESLPSASGSSKANYYLPFL